MPYASMKSEKNRSKRAPDLYTGGFWPFSSLEERWAWWSRHIYCNRYVPAPKPVYDDVLRLVRDKDYFVLTTNVDHQFQSAGFDKKRLFYMQGDYGLWQCSAPCHSETYDNEAAVRRMVSEQENMRIPSGLVPRCPRCGRPMTMNLRVDGSFVQDEGWYRAKDRYDDYLRRHEGMSVLLLQRCNPGCLRRQILLKYNHFYYFPSPFSPLFCSDFFKISLNCFA